MQSEHEQCGIHTSTTDSTTIQGGGHCQGRWIFITIMMLLVLTMSLTINIINMTMLFRRIHSTKLKDYFTATTILTKVTT